MNCEACGKREAVRGELCWACIKSRQRNGSTRRKKPDNGNRYESPEEMLQEAVLGLTEGEDKANAYKRYLMASLRYRRRRNTVHKPPQTDNRG